MSARATTVAPRDHAVTFYAVDDELAVAVARFAAEGLAKGDRVLMVATGPHHDAVDEVLLHYGVDGARVRAAGDYVSLDAAETLAEFMDGDRPDAARFQRVVGTAIDRARGDAPGIRVFGEMVALLWDEGNVSGAIALEGLWNALAVGRRFSLLCGYPTSALGDAPLAAADEMCRRHSLLEPPQSYSSVPAGTGAAAFVSQVFPPVPTAVPAARRFASEWLRSWADDQVSDDGALIVSELATNAVSHAASPFRLSVSREDGIARIAVEDAASARAQRRRPAPEGFAGRGLALVEKLSRRWGNQPRASGKVVWAELATRPAERS